MSINIENYCNKNKNRNIYFEENKDKTIVYYIASTYDLIFSHINQLLNLFMSHFQLQST